MRITFHVVGCLATAISFLVGGFACLGAVAAPENVAISSPEIYGIQTVSFTVEYKGETQAIIGRELMQLSWDPVEGANEYAIWVCFPGTEECVVVGIVEPPETFFNAARLLLTEECEFCEQHGQGEWIPVDWKVSAASESGGWSDMSEVAVTWTADDLGCPPNRTSYCINENRRLSVDYAAFPAGLEVISVDLVGGQVVEIGANQNWCVDSFTRRWFLPSGEIICDQTIETDYVQPGVVCPENQYNLDLSDPSASHLHPDATGWPEVDPGPDPCTVHRIWYHDSTGWLPSVIYRSWWVYYTCDEGAYDEPICTQALHAGSKR